MNDRQTRTGWLLIIVSATYLVWFFKVRLLTPDLLIHHVIQIGQHLFQALYLFGRHIGHTLCHLAEHIAHGLLLQHVE